MKTFIKAIMSTGILLPVSAVSFAAETTAYAYDAKGRLVRVVKAGSVNNGVTTTYEYDKADNRRNIKTTGASR